MDKKSGGCCCRFTCSVFCSRAEQFIEKILISQISQHEIFLQFYRRGTRRVSTPRYTEYLPLTRTITQSGDAEWTRGISLPRSWWWRWNRMFKCGFQKGLFCHYTLLKSTPNSGQLHILLILLLMSSAAWTTLHNWPYVRCSAKLNSGRGRGAGTGYVEHLNERNSGIVLVEQFGHSSSPSVAVRWNQVVYILWTDTRVEDRQKIPSYDMVNDSTGEFVLF